MKKLKIISLLILVLILELNFLYSQNNQPTLYQKKQLELSKKWFQILTGYQMSMTEVAFYEEITSGKDVKDFVLGSAIIIFATYNSSEHCEKIFSQMVKEFKESEKLKNEIDYRIEKEFLIKKENKEKEEKLRIEREKFEETDYGGILIEILESFRQWNQRGEFERETEYNIRLEKYSINVFDSICAEYTFRRIYHFDLNDYEKEISIYDSEIESFIISFNFNNNYLQYKIIIPFNQAQNFKNSFPYSRFYDDKYNWCFINNSLCPTSIIIQNENDNLNYLLSISTNGQKEIEYYFDSLKIQNEYLSGYKYKLSNYKIKEEKKIHKKRYLDSIQVIEYNLRIDSVVNSYNKSLLENPYNINQIVIKDYPQITDPNNIHSQYSSYIFVINKKDSELREKFILDYEMEYIYRGYEFKDKQEFRQFYTKGLSFYNNELERKKIFQDFSSNAYTIQKMNFRKVRKEIDDSTFYSNTLPLETIRNNNEKQIMLIINACKNKTYFSRLLEAVIGTNIILDKEWKKNGKYFKDNEEFYYSFITDNYKNKLKENKKKQK